MTTATSWLSSEFRDRKLELEFRQFQLPATQRFGLIATAVLVASFLIWLLADVSLPSPERENVLILRALGSTIGLACLSVIWRTRDVFVTETAISVATAGYFTCAFLVGLVHEYPVLYMTARTATLVGIISIFWQGQMLAGRLLVLLFAAANAGQVLSPFSPFPPATKAAVVPLILTIFLAGTLINHILQTSARRNFLELRRQRHALAETSHELRGPVSALQARIEAIRDGLCPCDTANIAILHDAVTGLSHLIDDLYTLARSDTGQLGQPMVAGDPSAVLDLAIDAYASRYAAAGLSIERSGPRAPVGVALQPLRLRQVFTNLLENTLRYTDGGGSLRITTAVSPDSVTILFDDTAPSPPPETLPRLFDRFYRVEPLGRRHPTGAGIGLAVCRSVIAAHHGRIEAAPSPLGGLRVAISLPRSPEIPS